MAVRVLVVARGIFVLCCGMWDLLVAACGIWFPDQGSNLGPLRWEHGVKGTGPPGKSCTVSLALTGGVFYTWLLIKWAAVLWGWCHLLDRWGSWGSGLSNGRAAGGLDQGKSRAGCLRAWPFALWAVCMDSCPSSVFWVEVGPACAPDVQTDPPRGAPSWCAYLVARASLGPRLLALCAAEAGQRD